MTTLPIPCIINGHEPRKKETLNRRYCKYCGRRLKGTGVITNGVRQYESFRHPGKGQL